MGKRHYIAAIAMAACGFWANAQEYVAPASGRGPAVILLSGISGTALYRDYAAEVAALGYTAVLVSGRDVANKDDGSGPNLKRYIAASQSDARVVPGKVGVIGFSLGGGGALLHAAPQGEKVAFVAAYYPAVTRLPSIVDVGRSLSVPTLILAGEKDRYNHCCLVESVRELEAAAKAAGRSIEVIVYPHADHGFNLKVPAYRADDAADAWARVKTMLAKHLPL